MKNKFDFNDQTEPTKNGQDYYYIGNYNQKPFKAKFEWATMTVGGADVLRVYGNFTLPEKRTIARMIRQYWKKQTEI